MRRLYVLYDARCGLCTWARRWMMRQPAFLELSFVPMGSPQAIQRFPDLAYLGTDDLVVVSDDGGVYRRGDAWILCLYALEDYREMSFRLAHPSLRPFAHQAFALLSKSRSRVSQWLRLASEAEIAETLRSVHVPPCTIPHPETAPSP